MKIDISFARLSGARAFVSAAACLAHVTAGCQSLSESVELDSLIEGLSTIISMKCPGCYVPDVFPSDLQTLLVHSCLSQEEFLWMGIEQTHSMHDLRHASWACGF